MTAIRRLPVILGSVALLAACGASTDAPADPPRTEDTAVTPDPSSPSTPARGDVVRAVDDLAAALGVAADEVEVVSVGEVTWRDGSRGCAEPGTSYTQALVDGSRITLRAGGRTYEYHSGGSQPPARCDKPTE